MDTRTTTDLTRAANRWRRERAAERAARAELARLVAAAVAAGASISEVARTIGVDRVEVRRMMRTGG